MKTDSLCVYTIRIDVFVRAYLLKKCKYVAVVKKCQSSAYLLEKYVQMCKSIANMMS